MAKRFESMFGVGNFFLEIQLIDQENLPASIIVAKALRYLSPQLNIPCVATPDAHYPRPEDAEDQRVLLSNNGSIDTPLKDIAKKLVRGDDISLGAFFKSRNYYIPGYEDVKDIHTTEEIENTIRIANMCEEYSITHTPIPPKFPLSKDITASERLLELCQIGWDKRWPLIQKVIKSTDHTEKEYKDRLAYELKVLRENGLDDYFLIVEDIVAFARYDGQLIGAGRGSGDGCFVLYLLGESHIDPIEHDLMFERFFNEGRSTKERVSLPDVDMDFEKFGRERVVQYIRERFGHDKVAQMITFNRMQGRTALQDVFRAHSACSPEERNRITKNIPDKDKISDQLQAMKKPSVIKWSLENLPDDFKQWCYIDQDGKLQGPFSKLFEQAIRLEGTKRSQSKHAAGVVIANEPLANICPMIHDKSSGEVIAGMEMNDLEAMGHVKFDILGIAVLDKIHGVQDLLKYGELQQYDSRKTNVSTKIKNFIKSRV
jgi:DNA polymerase-3 subunit alpha